ncbi:MAG: sugar-transfer associated ATP-grasp domain-containing protein [Hansschlegelia sp.]
MITSRSTPAGQFGPLLLAFGLALPLAAISLHVAPLRGVSKFEVGNDFIALVGLIFATIQLLLHRQSAELRAAWASAALGSLIIALEDHLEALFASVSPGLLEAEVSGVLWIAAASLFLLCGQRYAMRRHVMAVIRAGFALAMAAVTLNLFLHASGRSGTHHTLGKIEDFAEFSATALFMAGLLLTLVAPLKDYVFPADAVGLRARRLFYDFGLGTKQRYPAPYPIFALPVFSQLLTLGIIARFLPVAAGAVSRDAGRGAGAQLLDLLRHGFMHGIDAKSYYVHELYRQEPGLVEATISRVETKNGLNRWVQKLGEDHNAPRDMNDKLAFWRACEAYGVPSAPIIATVEDGAFVSTGEGAAFDRDLFVKDRIGRGGRSTLNFERISPFFYRGDDGALLTLDQIVLRLRALSARRRLIVQPKLQNHQEIRRLADKSLVVFRVMTCVDHRGEPHVTHGVLRLLRRFEPGWPKTPDADWGCAVDVETGEFGMMTGDAPETCTRWFADHPVTGERVAGRQLSGWSDIAGVAAAAHRVFSTRVLVGWDIGWTPEGPVILEGNSNPDFSYFQRVSRTPVGRSPLGPLLNAHLATLTAQMIRKAEARRL